MFALALIVRIAFLLLHATPPIADDAELYHQVAVNLQAGEGYTFHGAPFAGREPGYILIIAGLYEIFGPEPEAVHWLHALVGAVTAVITYSIGVRLGGRFIGLFAGVALAVWPTHFAYTDLVLTEVAATFSTALIILMILRVGEARSALSVILLAAAAAAACLIRANYLAVVIALPIFFRVAGWEWRRAVQVGSAAALIAVALYSPWVIRNAVTFDAFIPTRTGAGDIIWSGNYPPWDGNFLGYIPPLTTLRQGLDPVEADRKLYREAIFNILASPVQIAGTWLQKPFRVWAMTDLSLHRSPPLQTRDWRLLAGVLQQGMWLLLVLSAILGLSRWKESAVVRVLFLMLLLSTLTYLPLNAVPRYQTPFLPALFPLSAVGFAWALRRFRPALANVERKCSEQNRDQDMGAPR